MAVDFYMSKRGRKTEDIIHLGNGGYHCIRTYLLACFNVKLAKAYYVMDSFRTPEEKVMLQDISPYVPEGAWRLFCDSDGDGEWDNDTLKVIVREVKRSHGFLYPESVKKEIEAIVSSYSEDDKIHLAGFQNIPDWKDSALEFLSKLEKAAEMGCRVYRW